VTVVVAPHTPDLQCLGEVLVEMRTEYGRPNIRAWWDGEKWIALEGSHRLAAAAELGIVPTIEPMNLSDEIDHDFDDCVGKTVRDVLEYFSRLGPHYAFEELECG
jgi:hypothetical protein